jgi:hypothetical protein
VQVQAKEDTPGEIRMQAGEEPRVAQDASHAPSAGSRPGCILCGDKRGCIFCTTKRGASGGEAVRECAAEEAGLGSASKEVAAECTAEEATAGRAATGESDKLFAPPATEEDEWFQPIAKKKGKNKKKNGRLGILDG